MLVGGPFPLRTAALDAACEREKDYSRTSRKDVHEAAGKEVQGKKKTVF